MRAAVRGKIPLLAALLLFTLLPVASSPISDRQPITEALQWVRSSPKHVLQYNYAMTARVRLLFFWVGKDDVGGG